MSNTIKKENFAVLKELMAEAFTLKNILEFIPLTIKTNSQGEKYIKPNSFNPNLNSIKNKVSKFAEDIKGLSFEIDLFDDETFCTESAIIDSINHGTYNVAALCYNKALLTVYNQINENYGQNEAHLAYSYASSYASNNFDKGYIFDQGADL
jgi:hypothetical protein